jgi:D-cysteine desulfhydrase
MSRPLLTIYPGLEVRLPLLPLAELPTPVEHLAGLAGGLWVKRDDCTSALYGGNKVRKLEFVLGALLPSGCRHVVSFGATGTHHGVATAAFCQRHGIACTLLLFDQPASAEVAQNLRLMQAFGAQLIYCGSLWNTVLHFYLLQRLRCRNAYFLFAGGSSVEGSIGFVNAAFELRGQIERGLLPEPRIIYCALGSGGMLAGLTLGCALAGVNCEVRGVRVAASHLGVVPSCTTATVTRLMRQTYRHLQRLDPSIPNIALPDVKLEQEYFGDGYGVPSPAGRIALRRMAEVGIELDLTYTAKAAAAALDYCARHPGDTTLYWHSYNSVDMSTRAAGADLGELAPALGALVRRAESR